MFLPPHLPVKKLGFKKLHFCKFVSIVYQNATYVNGVLLKLEYLEDKLCTYIEFNHNTQTEGTEPVPNRYQISRLVGRGRLRYFKCNCVTRYRLCHALRAINQKQQVTSQTSTERNRVPLGCDNGSNELETRTFLYCANGLSM